MVSLPGVRPPQQPRQINFCGAQLGGYPGIPNKVNTTVNPDWVLPLSDLADLFLWGPPVGIPGDNKGGLEPIRANSLFGG